jgi:hypothetical protein
MSQPQTAPPAKLITGLLFRDFEAQRCALEALEEHFGALDFLTEPEAFIFTSYYDREMGPGLLRQTVAFLDLLPPDRLADAKLATNLMEQELARSRRRSVNIDPGLLSEERLVLATGKNYTHRIYLRDGVYADLTLIYQKGRYRALPWTYPDYQTPRLLHFFAVLRQKLVFQRHGHLPGHGVNLGVSTLTS